MPEQLVITRMIRYREDGTLEERPAYVSIRLETGVWVLLRPKSGGWRARLFRHEIDPKEASNNAIIA